MIGIQGRKEIAKIFLSTLIPSSNNECYIGYGDDQDSIKEFSSMLVLFSQISSTMPTYIRIIRDFKLAIHTFHGILVFRKFIKTMRFIA